MQRTNISILVIITPTPFFLGIIVETGFAGTFAGPNNTSLFVPIVMELWNPGQRGNVQVFRF